jgi:hypothetical protein
MTQTVRNKIHGDINRSYRIRFLLARRAHCEQEELLTNPSNDREKPGGGSVLHVTTSRDAN